VIIFLLQNVPLKTIEEITNSDKSGEMTQELTNVDFELIRVSLQNYFRTSTKVLNKINEIGFKGDFEVN
jgi:hypothetical protein